MITTEITLTDEMSPIALQAAEALDRVSEKEKEIANIAKQLGVSHAEAAKAVSMVEAETRKAEQATAKAEAAREREAREIEKARQAAEAKAKQEQAAIEKRIKEQEREAKQREAQAKQQAEHRRQTAISLGKVGVAAAAAGAAVAAIGAGLVAVAASAGRSRANAQALMHGLTNKEGERALSLVDGLAKDLGVSIADARDNFIKFRQAGMDNKTSANLIKLRADLMATGLTAESADEEIAKVLGEKDTKKQAAAIDDLKDRYEVLGDGALAAEKNQRTFAGALNRIRNVILEKTEALWSRIGPSIDKVATKVANFVEEMLGGERGEKIIEKIGKAFGWLADSIEPTLEFMVKHRKLIAVGLVSAVFAFGAVVAAIAKPFIVAGAAAAFFIAKAAFVGAAVGAAVAIITKHWDTIKELPGRLLQWGKDTVDGFINGVKQRISKAVSAVKNFAKSVAGPFAKALGISSPSKLFSSYGKDTVKGYEKGQEKEMDHEMPLQEAAQARPEAPGTPTGAGGAGAGSTEAGGNFVIEQLIVQGGGNPKEIAAAIRHEFEILMMTNAAAKGLL